MKFMVFDVESIGLHGEGYAFGYVVVDETGKTLEEGKHSCPMARCVGRLEDREWVKANIPELRETCDWPVDLRKIFWETWMRWKAEGAVLAADCCWPVEARFLAKCVDDSPDENAWDGPYPLHDLASILLAKGKDPLAVTERLPSELPRHDPLMDARQSARQIIEALA